MFFHKLKLMKFRPFGGNIGGTSTSLGKFVFSVESQNSTGQAIADREKTLRRERKRWKNEQI